MEESHAKWYTVSMRILNRLLSLVRPVTPTLNIRSEQPKTEEKPEPSDVEKLRKKNRERFIGLVSAFQYNRTSTARDFRERLLQYTEENFASLREDAQFDEREQHEIAVIHERWMQLQTRMQAERTLSIPPTDIPPSEQGPENLL